jgi:acetyltransferase
MKLEHVRFLFAPRRVAYVPAAGCEPAWDRAVAANLAASGFRGEVFTAQPQEPRSELPGTVVPLDALPGDLDVAVVSLPRGEGERLVEVLAEKGCKAMILVGAAATGGAAGSAARRGIRAAARARGLRVLGPARLGVIAAATGFNAGAWRYLPASGPLALVTQSDSIAATLMDWAAPRRIGFSKILSLGETEDAELGDIIDFLALDRETRAILLHVQSFTDARRLLSAGRVASRAKPVVVVRGGRWSERAGMGELTPGRIMRPSDVYHAAFKRAGMVRVETLEGLFAAAETLSLASLQSWRSLRAGRLAIVSNGSGPAILAADTLVAHGGLLAELPDELRPLSERDREARVNIADLGADAGPDAYRSALERLAGTNAVDAVLAIRCPSGASNPIATANAVIEGAERLARSYRLPVLTAWLGEREAQEARERFLARGMPTYATPEQAVDAFMVRVRHERNQAMLLEIPRSLPHDHRVDRARAGAIVAAARSQGANLAGPDALALADAYGLVAAPMRRLSAVKDVVPAAVELGFPVLLTVLGKPGPPETAGPAVSSVRFAYRAATERVLRHQLAELRATGVTREGRLPGRYVVQSAARDPNAGELFFGLATDPHFGPIIVVGHGGRAASAIRDVAFGLPPLNASLAKQLLAETRVGRLLLGAGERGGKALDAVLEALCDFSQLVIEQTSIVEAELNPVWVSERGVVIGGAAFRFGDPASRKLSIQPYPVELEQKLVLYDGREVLLRPLRPEDGEALKEAFIATDETDRRMRLFTSLRELSDEMAARLTQIDYDREMALAAFDPAQPEELLGGARIIADPDNRTAEFAVSVRSAMKGTGLGPKVLARVIDYAEARGIGQVWGTVLRENKPMLAVCERLGFRRQRDDDDPEAVRVVLDLPRMKKPAGEATREDEGGAAGGGEAAEGHADTAAIERRAAGKA